MRWWIVGWVALCAGAVWLGVKSAKPPLHTLQRDSERLVLASPSGYQTVAMLDGGPTGFYYDAATDLLKDRTGVSSVVLLGLGGGEMLRQAHRVQPKAALYGVEIDETTAHLARTVFSVPGSVIVSDAIEWVDIWPAQSVDVLMVDLYTDSSMVPASIRLTFLAGCYRLLRHGGLFMMNVWPASRADEIERTLLTLYPKVSRRSYGANVVLFTER